MIQWYCKIEDLNPGFAALVMGGLEVLSKSPNDFCIPASGGWRPDQVQFDLYAQGRTKKGPIVTNVDGVKIKSMHQKRLAVDIVPMDKKGNPIWPALSDQRWQEIREAMQGHGLRWGGDWDGDGKTRSEGDIDEKFIDYPHWEMCGI